jgi:hypothetical protein
MFLGRDAESGRTSGCPAVQAAGLSSFLVVPETGRTLFICVLHSGVFHFLYPVHGLLLNPGPIQGSLVLNLVVPFPCFDSQAYLDLDIVTPHWFDFRLEDCSDN